MENIPITELKNILKPPHFEMDEVNSRIGISISSDILYINVSDYNDLIDAIPQNKVFQSVYVVTLKNILPSNIKHNSVARIIRQLRYMWRHCPQFGIQEIIETTGVKKMIYLKCTTKVKLNFNASEPISKYFGGK